MNDKSMLAQGPVDVNVRGWMPIKTAPRDGTRVMLYYPKLSKYGHEKVVFGRWDIDRYAKYPKPYWTNDQENLWEFGN